MCFSSLSSSHCKCTPLLPALNLIWGEYCSIRCGLQHINTLALRGAAEQKHAVEDRVVWQRKTPEAQLTLVGMIPGGLGTPRQRNNSNMDTSVASAASSFTSRYTGTRTS